MTWLHRNRERSDILRRWRAAAAELADVHLGDPDADFVFGLLKKYPPHRRHPRDLSWSEFQQLLAVLQTSAKNQPGRAEAILAALTGGTA